jgi:transcriptional regulator of acetoin/glycerol metabolism
MSEALNYRTIRRNGAEKVMAKKRNRFKQTTSLAERLTAQAGRLRELARNLPPGAEQTTLWRKVRQTETALHIDAWLSSSGDLPPNEV